MNTNKLRGVMAAHGETGGTLADAIGITYQSLSKKLNGHSEFTRSEIYTISSRYGLTADEIVDIFFDDECHGMTQIQGGE